MPNYYLVVEKVGEGSWEDSNGRLKHWDLPESWGFKSEKDAKKLQSGDKLVGYVAPIWGFALIMMVKTWENGQAYKEFPVINPKYPFRVKVKVECEIKDRHLMPKWKDVWPYLEWCRGKNAKLAALTLHTNILKINNKDDYELIARAICRAAKQ